MLYEKLIDEFIEFLEYQAALRLIMAEMAFGELRDYNTAAIFNLSDDDCIELMKSQCILLLKSWCININTNNKRIINASKDLISSGFGWGLDAEFWAAISRRWRDHIDSLDFNVGPKCKSIW